MSAPERTLVVGCGLVGTLLAERLRAAGGFVIGTTTTPGKVEALSSVCDEVAVLRGSDTDAVAAAAAGCDAVVVCAGPSAQRAMTREDRAATYHDVLVATAESVTAAAPSSAHIIGLSSLAVYGSGPDDVDVIDEDTPVTSNDDPSPVKFAAAEQVYRTAAAGRSTIFRCADIFGAGDPPIEAKIRMAHEILGGSVPFSADALFYRIHVSDVAAAIAHVLAVGPAGTLNLTHDGVPARNAELFDKVSAELGFGPLTYRGEIEGPVHPVSVERLLATGFTPTLTAPTTL